MMKQRFINPRLWMLLIACIYTNLFCKASDGDVFKSVTTEGIEIRCKVISESEKTASVCGYTYTVGISISGNPTVNISPAIPSKTEGIVSIPSECNGYTIIEIGNYTFYNCKKLTSITIPNNVTSIGGSAFYGCTGLTSITIPSNVTSIGGSAFYGCTGLTSITIPSNVATIGESAFSGCTGLTSIIIPSNVTDIGTSAFDGCTNLLSVTLNSNTIVSKDYKTNASLKAIFGPQVESYIIGNDVTSIGAYAFQGCSGLTSVSIPNSITNIESYAFYGCRNLALIEFPSNIRTIKNYTFYGCSGLTAVDFPSNITTIEYNAFENCTGLTSLTIPKNISSIGFSAFKGCNSLKSITYHCQTIGNWMGGSSSASQVIIGNEVKTIGANAFAGFANLTSVEIPNSVTQLGIYAFSGCSELSSVQLPVFLQSIGGYAFTNCPNLRELQLPDYISTIADGYYNHECFDNTTKLYVNKGTKTLLSLWNTHYTPYGKSSEVELTPPYLSVLSKTQTTAKLLIRNYEDNITFSYKYSTLNIESDYKVLPVGNVINMTGLKPGETKTLYLRVINDGVYYLTSMEYTTKAFTPTIKIESTGPSSISASGTYNTSELEVTKEEFAVCTIYEGGTGVSIPQGYYYYTSNGSKWYAYYLAKGTEAVEGKSILATGLSPQTRYYVLHKVTTKNYGDFVSTSMVSTKALTLNCLTPKIAKQGEAIVAAETNLDDEEISAGFEWRKENAPSSLESKQGNAIVYNGRLEGIIKNLQTGNYYKVRPFYKSGDNQMHYGDWKTFDPDDFSYFEPTVYTYDNALVENGKVTIKGYVLPGSDDITEQGFEYWQTETAGAASQDVQTATASGQRMAAELTGLLGSTTYGYRAYVKTVKGTTYGEERTFTTEADNTGIETISGKGEQQKPFNVYSLSGALVRRQTTSLEGLPRGIYIVNHKKVMVK